MKNNIIQQFENLPFKQMSSIFIIFFVGMILGSIGYSRYYKKTFVKSEKVAVNYPLPSIIEEQRETTNNAKIINLLLMGHGGSGHSGGGLMDAILVVSVNITDKKAGIVSIPRDFWFSGHKINADPSIKDAITGVTGLPISNTISIDFGSFVRMVDSLDGISVDVKKAYQDNFYPIKGKENELCGMSPEQVTEVHLKYSGFELEKQFVCRYETISYSVGVHNMTGEEALKYVRSRHGGNDFERSRHQFEVLKAILQKANVGSVEKAFDFVDTNLTVESITKLLAEIGNPLEYSVTYQGISDENVLVNSKSSAGAYILIPKAGIGNYLEIKEYIKNNL